MPATTEGEGTRVVLAGAHGHGRWHLENLRRLEGRVDLVGVCDLVPAERDVLGDIWGDVLQRADLGELLEQTRPEITIIATPIQTHTELTLSALAHGSHVLLEKPPAPAFAAYERLVAGVDASAMACQIGFQSLGSHAIAAARKLIADGVVGGVRGIGAAGSWARDEGYFRRAAWAGRRRLDGVDVVDGALTNPFAHAVATALALDGSESGADVEHVETELFHAYPIESDDTSCVRLRTRRGTVVTVAVSLCGPRRTEPYVIVHGDRGRITLTYTRDTVCVERAGRRTSTAHPRTDLLENLIDHVRDGAGLLVPPARTGAFMRVMEAVRVAPPPLPIPGQAQEIQPGRRVLPGIEGLVAKSAERLALFSELGVPWAGGS